MDISFGEISSQGLSDSNEPNFEIIEEIGLSRKEN